MQTDADVIVAGGGLAGLAAAATAARAGSRVLLLEAHHPGGRAEIGSEPIPPQWTFRIRDAGPWEPVMAVQ